MGVIVPEMTAGSKAPLAAGEWEVRVDKFVAGESSKKKTPYVQLVLSVLDEEAEDAEGEPYGKRKLYADTFYLTPAAMWRLKKFLVEDAGVDDGDIPSAGAEYESWGEYASALTDFVQGLEGTVVTSLETYEANDGTDKQKVVVEEYNF